MPELPEVETIRGQLARDIPGRVVTDAGAHESAKFVAATQVCLAQLASVSRRGKYLIFTTSDGRDMVVHLGMTGSLGFTDEPATTIDQDGAKPWRRAWWRLDDGRTLEYTDQRRFGRISVVQAGRYETLGTLGVLGPEPFDPAFTPATLHKALKSQRRHVKTALLAQRVVAGIGNIYADEALWRARINPCVRRVGPQRCVELHRAIIDVLTEGIQHGGTRLRDYRSVDGDTGAHQLHLDCYGRAGSPCHRCGTKLHHRVLDGRGTTWCPVCQSR